MADVAEECGLGAIDLGQRLRALALLLVRARAGQADGDLFGDPADEVTVGVVERAARMDAEHQEPGRLAALAQPDRHEPSLARAATASQGWTAPDARSPRSTTRQSSASAVLNRQMLSLLQSMTAGCRESSVSTLTLARRAFCSPGQILVEKCERGAGAILAERVRADAPHFFLVVVLQPFATPDHGAPAGVGLR